MVHQNGSSHTRILMSLSPVSCLVSEEERDVGFKRFVNLTIARSFENRPEIPCDGITMRCCALVAKRLTLEYKSWDLHPNMQEIWAN